MFDFSGLGKHQWTDLTIAVPVVPVLGSGGQAMGELWRFSRGDFFLIFYSQSVITFTTAQLELTTKRAAQSANTLYMEFIKQ